MTPRNTTTGGVLEAMVLPALKRGGYSYETQQRIGERFGGGVHIVEVIAEKDGQKYLVSMKWQQVSGTAEQKVPFEVICLADSVFSGAFSKAYRRVHERRGSGDTLGRQGSFRRPVSLPRLPYSERPSGAQRGCRSAPSGTGLYSACFLQVRPSCRKISSRLNVVTSR